ncbi:metallophosphoesterase family protein [Roseateles sp. DC23W]|uniref:Metallophosphoesterase family protein n=1 Tax=Pelomonas dachongensis TaxID=3299029 RepID=A0ABW7ETC9_9BURK
MTVLLQVSDTHFGTERPVAMAALQQLCAELSPDLLLVTGDITQRARRREFERARAFFDTLAVPARLIVPGNHDIPLFDLATRLLHPYSGFERVFGAALEGEFERDDLLVITLNTTRRWRHSNGEVSRAQVARVAERLARARPAQLKLVAVHQPVAAVTHEDVANLLRGRHHALKRWAAAGVDAVVGGHIHLPYVLPLRERWPELPREVWAVQAGTAVSSRLRGGISNSVNVIRGVPAATVERWDLDEAQARFQLVQATALR